MLCVIEDKIHNLDKYDVIHKTQWGNFYYIEGFRDVPKKLMRTHDKEKRDKEFKRIVGMVDEWYS